MGRVIPLSRDMILRKQNREVMRCPYCQTVHPPTARFCLECVRRFGVCPNCGTVNPPMAKFCIECGLRLQAPERGQNVQKQNQNISQAGRTDRSVQNGQNEQDGQTKPLPDMLTTSEERRVVTVM